MFRSFLYVLLGASVLFAVPPSESHASWNRQFRQSARYWQRQHRQLSNHRDRHNAWSYRRGYSRPYWHRGRYRGPYRGGVFIGPYGVTW